MFYRLLAMNKVVYKLICRYNARTTKLRVIMIFHWGGEGGKTKGAIIKAKGRGQGGAASPSLPTG